MKGEPVLARPIGAGGRIVRWCRRNPAVASLTAVLILALVGGMAGIARQWRQAEVERRNAVASDLEAEQLLSELIASNPVIPIFGYRVAVPSVEPLLKAAAHCKSHLQKNPADLQLRIALTNVYGSLGTLYLQRRQIAEMEASFHNARNLWEPLVSDRSASPVYRDWLATTYDWDTATGPLPRDLESIEQANSLWEKLAEEQPANLDFMEKVRRTHTCDGGSNGEQRGQRRLLPTDSRHKDPACQTRSGRARQFDCAEAPGPGMRAIGRDVQMGTVGGSTLVVLAKRPTTITRFWLRLRVTTYWSSCRSEAAVAG